MIEWTENLNLWSNLFFVLLGRMIIPIQNALDGEESYGILELQGTLSEDELQGLELGELNQSSEVLFLLL